MYCINCGSELENNAKFCRFCGHPVSSGVSSNPTSNYAPVINKAKHYAKDAYSKINTFLKDQGIIVDNTPKEKTLTGSPSRYTIVDTSKQETANILDDASKKATKKRNSKKDEPINIVHPTFGFAFSFVVSVLILLGFIVHFLVRLAKSNIDVFTPVIVIISIVLFFCLMMSVMSYDQDDFEKLKRRYSKFNGWIKKDSSNGILIIFGISIIDFFLGIIVLIQALT